MTDLKVNVNPSYQPSELKYALNKVGVKAIVMAESFKDRHFYSILNEAVPELSQTKPMDSIHSREVPSLQCVIIISEDLPKYLIKISIHISFVIN